MRTTHQLFINSSDREDYQNTTPANCRINIQKLVNPHCIELSFAQIPCTFYNINSTNNKFNIDDTIYQVPVGSYGLNDLLQAMADAVSGFLTVQYNDVTNKITLSASTTFTIDFTVANSIYSKIGFLHKPYSGSNSYTATHGPKLYDSAIFINVNEIPAGCVTSNSTVRNASFVVPVNVNMGEIIQFYAHSQFSLQPRVHQANLQHFDIKFYNDQGVQLEGLSDWVLMLKIFYD